MNELIELGKGLSAIAVFFIATTIAWLSIPVAAFVILSWIVGRI